jgi:hypothetical protein
LDVFARNSNPGLAVKENQLLVAISVAGKEYLFEITLERRKLSLEEKYKELLEEKEEEIRRLK